MSPQGGKERRRVVLHLRLGQMPPSTCKIACFFLLGTMNREKWENKKSYDFYFLWMRIFDASQS